MGDQAAGTPAVNAAAQIDLEQFRLRRFVSLLEKENEREVRTDPIDLIDLARNLDGNPKAVLFTQVGPEKTELVGNVLSGRRRLALGFGVNERELLPEVMARIRKPIAPVEVPSSVAPVHQVVLKGDDADFTKLPVHLHQVLCHLHHLQVRLVSHLLHQVLVDWPFLRQWQYQFPCLLE